MEAYVKRNTLHKGITEIEFYHPAHNSLPGDILKKLAAEIEKCSNDLDVSVIILRSGGDRTFCAGASFNELINIENAEGGKAFFMGFANVINACRKSEKLIIGRVQGKAVGGGVGLAAAVDYCVATKYAAIKLSELNIGIGPFVIGPAVVRKIGLAAMSQCTLDANNFFPAEWAQSRGLYTSVVEDIEALDAEVMRMADYLAGTNPEARKTLKKVFWEGTADWDNLLATRAEMSGSLVLSEETKNILAKYK